MTPLKILRQTRELLSAPERWTKEAFARDSPGELAGAQGRDAVCWCLDGALMRSVGGTPGRSAVLQLLSRAAQIDNIWTWNDAPERTHAEVLAVLDKAIALAESEAT
jgi:hypothetical protein